MSNKQPPTPPASPGPAAPLDHPGPEWSEWTHPDGSKGEFWNPGINPTGAQDAIVLWYRDGVIHTRDAAIAHCRQISAAALAWEQQKAEVLATCFHNPVTALILELRSRQ